MTAADDHCANLVRAADKDRYLSALFAPDSRRPHLLALYAFDLEIRRIREAVSEPQLGLIRQQWWLDTVDTIYGGEVPAHPVAQGLSRAVEAGHLPKHALHNLVQAREFDLYADPMPDLASLEGYLGETAATLIQMAALVLAGTDAGRCAEAAGLAGVALGLSLLLQQQPLRHLPPGMDLAAAVSHAQDRLAAARRLRHTIPEPALPAFLPVSLTELYLAGARRRRSPSQFRRQWTLWRAARRNQF